jgi:hypothetical protein
MNITGHPKWCTGHTADDDHTSVEHRHDVEFCWRPPGDDVDITVAAVRRDEVGPVRYVGPEEVALTLFNTACTAGTDKNGREIPLSAEVGLDVPSARKLAEILLAAADLVEQATR